MAFVPVPGSVAADGPSQHPETVWRSACASLSGGGGRAEQLDFPRTIHCPHQPACIQSARDTREAGCLPLPIYIFRTYIIVSPGTSRQEREQTILRVKLRCRLVNSFVPIATAHRSSLVPRLSLPDPPAGNPRLSLRRTLPYRSLPRGKGEPT